MPSTPIYGFPFEKTGDQPGHSVHGGQSGTDPILAEAVETELERVDSTASDLQAQVTALQAEVDAMKAGELGIGWTLIAKGNHSGGTFSIDVTDGGRFDPAEFSLIRLHARYDLDGGAESYVYCQVNGDSTAGLHRTGGIVWDADGNQDVTFHQVAQSWRLAYGSTISTGNFTLQIFHTAVDPGLLNYQAYGTRQSDTSNVHRWTTAWGSLTAARTLSSLQMFAETTGGGGSDQFTNIWWWLEGFRTDNP